jgi:MarR-like DNA-binding transcriptional regulator SgrR of sgrS sRNA
VLVALVPALLVTNSAFVSNASCKNIIEGGSMTSTVRTYMAYPDKADPAHILTMADLELSMALASTLVAFDEERELISGLATKWAIVSSNKVQFILRDGLKWSDGSSVTAEQYKLALLRAKRVYADDLKPLFDAVTDIEAPDSRTLVITTREDINSSGILLKLTEPMYGLVALNRNGELDLSKTVGPYVVKSQSTEMLTLVLNHNWYLRQPNMPESVEIKRPVPGKNGLATFVDDKWANLISGSSIVNSEVLTAFNQNGYRTWQRTEDKLFALYPSRDFVMRGGAEVMKLLAGAADKDNLLAGLSGYTTANQFFPRGYALWSTTQPRQTKSAIAQFNGPIRVLIPEGYSAIPLKEKLIQLIKQSTGAVEVTVEIIPYSALNAHMKAQDYEILGTGLAVADPNFEGAVSFFIERDPPFIPSGKAPTDFADQVRTARSLSSTQERAAKIRDILIKAQEAGYVLPLFHFSSLAAAKPGIDMSEISNSDESVQFAKLRMKQ